MRYRSLILGTILGFSIAFLPVAHADSSLWKFVSGYLQPVVSTWDTKFGHNVNVQGVLSGNKLYAGSMSGAGLGTCNGGTSALTWNAATSRFGCNAISAGSSTFSTGNVLTINGSYVKKAGDTMTGSLNILNGKNLQVAGTITGSVIKAATTLTSSGTLIVEGVFSGSTVIVSKSFSGAGLTGCTGAAQALQWNATTGRFGCVSPTGTTYTAGQGLSLSSTSFKLLSSFSGAVISATNTLASSGTLIWENVASGSALYVQKSFSGAGLTSCSNGVTSKLLWNSTTGRFSCGTDTDTNTTYAAAQGLSLVSGNFRLNASFSGTVISATTTLASSGTLVWENVASGSALYVQKSFSGAGLTDCTGANALRWAAATGRFSCAADAGGTSYTAGQGLTLTSTSFKLNSTITGSLASYQTLSGASVNARLTLTSSGGLKVLGDISGATLNVNGTSTLKGSVTIGKSNSTSVRTIFLSDFSTANGGVPTFIGNWNVSNNWGIGGAPQAGGYIMLGNVTTSAWGAAQTVQIYGHSFSGSILRAQQSLASSGSLTWEGTASGARLLVAAMSGAGLTDCSTASTSKLLWTAATGRFSCGTDQTSATAFTAGVGLNLLHSTAFQLNTTITGSVITALTTLASSGTLVIEGVTSGSTIYASKSFSGAGLTDCRGATNGLTWNSTTGRFGCGTPTGTTYTAGQGLTLVSTSFKTNAYMTGATFFASTALRSSGSLIWDGTGSGQALNLAGANTMLSTSGSDIFNVLKHNVDFQVRGATDGALITADASTDRIGIGTATPRTKLEVAGTISGSLITSAQFSGSIIRSVFAVSPVKIELIPFGTGTSVGAGSGKIKYIIDKTMSGFRLNDLAMYIDSNGRTNTTQLQVRDRSKGNRKMLTTNASIDSSESGSDTAATPFVIDQTKNDVSGGDWIYIDIPGVSTTAPKGLNVILYFAKP